MIASVIVDIKNGEVDKIFEYVIPLTLCVNVGHRVLVPFGSKYIEGFVIEIKETSTYDMSKLKEISKLLDEEIVIKPEMIKLMEFMTQKYNLRKIDTLRLFIPSELRGGRVKSLVRQSISINDKCKCIEFINEANKRQVNHKKIIEYLFANGEILKSELSLLFPISAINKLVEIGLLKVDNKRLLRRPIFDEKEDKIVTLNNYQQKACSIIDESKGDVVLLYGVTGSGKTEVYMHEIEKVVKDGKTAIMLVPEISLTPQVLSNFKARFGDDVAILHSGLSAGERFDEWEKLLTGQAKIAVGARSAIFAPLDNLGIIVIDEEHDGSYTSDSNPRYNTIDIAKFRAKYNDCAVVLGSATPSVETFYFAKQGIYKIAELPARVNNRKMPTMYITNMYQAILKGNYNAISSVLEQKLNKCIDENRQAILFLNRRGFVSFLRCSNCGYTPYCTDCEVALVYHKEDNLLKCHFCDKRYQVLTKCPECGAKDFRVGAMGTQKIVEDVQNMFPNVKVFRMDNDTITSKDSYYKILKEFGETKPAILIGTQMLAKGHDFPFVTLVGIIDADIGLHQSDFRANERCFQLVTQVAGRAGRSDYEGEVVLQTYKPSHYVYKFASNYDYLSFFERELALRKTTKFPPFSYIIRVLFSGEEQNDTIKAVGEIYAKIDDYRLKNAGEFVFYKAVACPVKRIKTKYRYEILARVKIGKEQEIVKQIYKIVDESKTKFKKVNIFVETNPQNLS